MLERDLIIDTATIFSLRDQPALFSRLAGWYTDCLWHKDKLFFPQQVTPEYLRSELDLNRFGVLIVTFPSCRPVAACAGEVIVLSQSVVLTVDWEYMPTYTQTDRWRRKERASWLRQKSLQFVLNMHILHNSITSPQLPDVWWRDSRNAVTRFRLQKGVWVMV